MITVKPFSVSTYIPKSSQYDQNLRQLTFINPIKIYGNFCLNIVSGQHVKFGNISKGQGVNQYPQWYIPVLRTSVINVMIIRVSFCIPLKDFNQSVDLNPINPRCNPPLPKNRHQCIYASAASDLSSMYFGLLRRHTVSTCVGSPWGTYFPSPVTA